MDINSFNPLAALLNLTTTGPSDPTKSDYLQTLLDLQAQSTLLTKHNEVQVQQTKQGQDHQQLQKTQQQAHREVLGRLQLVDFQIAKAEEQGHQVPDRVYVVRDAIAQQLDALPPLPEPTRAPAPTPRSAPATPEPLTFKAPLLQDPTTQALQERLDQVKARLDGVRAQRMAAAPPTAGSLPRPQTSVRAATTPADPSVPRAPATEGELLQREGAGQKTTEDRVARPFTRPERSTSHVEEAALQTELTHLEAQLAGQELAAQASTSSGRAGSGGGTDAAGGPNDFSSNKLDLRIRQVKDALIKLGSGYDLASDPERMEQATQLRQALTDLEGQRDSRAAASSTRGGANVDSLWKTYESQRSTDHDPQVEALVKAYFGDSDDFSQSTPRPATTSGAAPVAKEDAQALASSLATKFLNVNPDAQSLDPAQQDNVNRWMVSAYNQLADQASLGKTPGEAQVTAQHELERQFLKSPEGSAPLASELGTLMKSCQDQGAISLPQLQSYQQLMQKMGPTYVSDMTARVLRDPKGGKDDVLKALFSEVMGHVNKDATPKQSSIASFVLGMSGRGGTPGQFGRR